MSLNRSPRGRLLLVAAALLGVLIGGVGTYAFVVQSHGDGSAADAAREVAESHASRFAAGDYAGAWDLLSADGQAAISRDEYVRLATECRSRYTTTAPFTAESVRLDSADRAAFTAQRGGRGYSLDLVFEHGQWRVSPPPHMWLDYTLSVDELIAKRRANGDCL